MENNIHLLFQDVIQKYLDGQKKMAGQSCRRILAFAPAHADCWHLLGMMDSQDTALDFHIRSIVIKPDMVAARNAAAIIFYDLGLVTEAMSHWIMALCQIPDNSNCLRSLGIVWLDSRELQKSLCFLHRVIAVFRYDADAYFAIGNVYLELFRRDEAIEYWSKAIAIRPEFIGAHYNLAFAKLSEGKYAEAWRGFEWRWPCRFDDLAPRWRGTEGKGRTLLIHAEAGFGDSLQFCRFIPSVAAMGWKIILVVQKPLLRLFRSLEGVEQLLSDKEELPAFDMHCPMMSLLFAVGARIEAIPSPRCLQADTMLVDYWRKRLDAVCGNSLRVGLAWSGSAYETSAHTSEFGEMNQRRSIRPELLRPILNFSNITFVSLQKDGWAAPSDLQVINFMNEIDDFADSAALIVNLDLVITVDTAVVHLAGVLGKDVWLLNRFDSCWRWLNEGDASPWYPTMRIFRQTKKGDWVNVIGRVKKALDIFYEKKMTSMSVLNLWSRPPDDEDTDYLLTKAFSCHREGKLVEAEQIYRRILASFPIHADSLHLLGVMACGVGRPDFGTPWITRAIVINSENSVYHGNLAMAARDSGLPELSVIYYRKAIIVTPDMSEHYYRLSGIFQAQANIGQAVLSGHRAMFLKPEDILVINNYGILFYLSGHKEKAAEIWCKAICLAPYHVAAHASLGVARQEAGNFGMACLCYYRSIAIQPDHIDSYYNIGNLLKEIGESDQAVRAWRGATILQPDHIRAYSNLGAVLGEIGRGWEAEAVLQRAVWINDLFPDAFVNLGVILQGQERWQEAVFAYRRAIAMNPDSVAAHFNLAHCLLTLGDYDDGWREYEWRLKTNWKNVVRRLFKQPQWQGEVGDGRILLIHADGGFYGDSLQFCRFIPMAAAMGWRVIVEIPALLIRLLRKMPGIDVLVARGEHLPHFDVHCPIMSLPFALGARLGNLPATPYLYPDQDEVDIWRNRLNRDFPGEPKVGLVWSGHPYLHSADIPDRRRSINPELLAPLFLCRGIRFFNLQKDGSDIPKDWPVIDFMDEIEDFDDSAALVVNMDLVISVDTAMIHLAGSLGCPVWMMDRFDACWRWLRGREDSPWYSSLRIFRQSDVGEWEPVIYQIKQALEARFPSGPLP